MAKTLAKSGPATQTICSRPAGVNVQSSLSTIFFNPSFRKKGFQTRIDQRGVIKSASVLSRF